MGEAYAYVIDLRWRGSGVDGYNDGDRRPEDSNRHLRDRIYCKTEDIHQGPNDRTKLYLHRAGSRMLSRIYAATDRSTRAAPRRVDQCTWDDEVRGRREHHRRQDGLHLRRAARATEITRGIGSKYKARTPHRRVVPQR